jgi:chromosome segregation ATPase
MHNTSNIVLLCQGDAVHEQELCKQLVEAKTILSRIRARIQPTDILAERIKGLAESIENVTRDQREEEMAQRKAQNRTRYVELELARAKGELSKLHESIAFKDSVHQQLQKNLRLKKQHVTKWKAIKDELQKRYSTESESLALERQRQQERLEKLTLAVGRLRQKLAESEHRAEVEKASTDDQIMDWRERTRQATQRRRDISDTAYAAEMETRLVQARLQRYIQKLNTQQKRYEAAHNELLQMQHEIQEMRDRIGEYTIVPLTYTNSLDTLAKDNKDLDQEVARWSKDETQASDHAAKLRDELKELESMEKSELRRKIISRQKVLEASLVRIHGTIASAKSSYICFECLEPVKTPITFVPCGHSVCQHHGKHRNDSLTCPECQADCEIVFANPTIPELTSKLHILDSMISTEIIQFR